MNNCKIRHTNKLDYQDAKQLSLDELKQLRYNDTVYLKSNCGCLLAWRVNGKVQTWKRDPKRIRIPIKYGLYGYSYITEYDTVYQYGEKS